jgi:hypothetical protein
MPHKDIALMAHLMRRAGFGAHRDELELRVAKGYESTVEELLDPKAHGIPQLDERLMFRRCPSYRLPGNPMSAAGYWMYRLINSPRPLEEKIALLWHQIFATAVSKVAHPPEMIRQIGMFRRYGMGSYRRLLLKLSKNPAMIFWLDNNENHKDAPNENWGRELLELFSMGHGNYSETDVKECARAFTGWTLAATIPGILYNRFQWEFEYRESDHDQNEKCFLGEQGNLNGEDIIDIILKQPATARFLARHLYNFFVADEVSVPSWHNEPARDPHAIEILAKTLTESGFNIRSTLRVLFNSDFFKTERCWFSKVKSPVEVVTSTMKFVGNFKEFRPGFSELGEEVSFQGQTLLNPPSVEGWHTGPEWIDTGTLLQRINFVADQMVNPYLPGIRCMIDRLNNQTLSTSEELVDGCLDLMGPIQLEPKTREEIVAHIKIDETTDQDPLKSSKLISSEKVGQILQLVVSTREFQMG